MYVHMCECSRDRVDERRVCTCHRRVVYLYCTRVCSRGRRRDAHVSRRLPLLDTCACVSRVQCVLVHTPCVQCVLLHIPVLASLPLLHSHMCRHMCVCVMCAVCVATHTCTGKSAGGLSYPPHPSIWYIDFVSKSIRLPVASLSSTESSTLIKTTLLIATPFAPSKSACV